jgi:hypothetical protein
MRSCRQDLEFAEADESEKKKKELILLLLNRGAGEATEAPWDAPRSASVECLVSKLLISCLASAASALPSRVRNLLPTSACLTNSSGRRWQPGGSQRARAGPPSGFSA